MLVTKYPYIDENGNELTELVKHYSDTNKYIRQEETGVEYEAAIDVYPCRYTYTETDKDIKSDLKSEEEV